ncbi:MAG: dTDP-glucose 4,6-dehydratase [Desulfarculus sp.]|nr:dTDP-glucose 4,6-dehydratase [Desulfarculus sp.]
MRILVTGGCGFIGSNFIRHLLANHPADEVVNLDLLTYAGNPANLADVQADYAGRYRLIRGDICDAELVAPLVAEAEAVAHFAAESHVDRSISDAGAFVRTNVLGTQTLLQAALAAWGGDASRRFLYVSTDEVYGALALDDPRRFREDWPLDPKSPYSASKAGGDLLARAYHHTHGLPVLVSRCSNNYGPYQFPEKLIPLMILNALAGRELPVYGDGLYVRDWLHVEDHCRAADLILRAGRPGEVYNIGGGNERSNLDLLHALLELVAQRTGRDIGQLRGLIRHVKDRPGHDRRYAIDAGKLGAELGWSPRVGLDQGLAATVAWYLEHGDWCQAVTSGAYRDYYRRMYDGR